MIVGRSIDISLPGAASSPCKESESTSTQCRAVGPPRPHPLSTEGRCPERYCELSDNGSKLRCVMPKPKT